MSLFIDHRAFSVKALAALAIIASITITFSCTKETVLEVSSTTASLERSAGTSMSVSVTANKPWTATSSASWLTLSTASGEAGTFTIGCSYTENTDIPDRSATITVTCQDAIKTISVSQAGRRLEVSLNDITLTSSKGSSKTLTITTADSWSLTSSDTKGAGWLTIEPSSGPAGTFTITISVTEDNPDYDERNAYLTFKVGNASSIVTVTQKQKDAIILQKDRVEMPAEGGSFDVALKSNVDYQVTIPESCKSWISRIQSKGLVSSTESFTVKAGTEDGSREGSIIFIDAASGVSDTLHVFQAQVNKLLLDGEAVQVAAAGGSIEVNVKANIDYSAQLVGSPDWLKVVTTKAVRQDKIYLQADANRSYGERSAVLRVTGSSLSDEITITQLQNNALIISTHKYEMPQEGGLFDVEVSSNVKYSYRIEDNAQWLRFVTTKSLISNTLQFEVYANTGYGDRTARIIFSSQDDPDLPDTIVVSQAKLKHLEIEPRTASFPKAGGSIDIKVSTNVDYSAEVIKGSEWLHKAEDRFTADENKDYDPREAVVVYRENGGTLTDTLKVSQAEATFFSISKHTAELGQEGGSVEVEAKSNLEYEVIIPADAPWITEITSKGLASKAHTFAVAANETYMAREATIQFRVKDGSQTETLKTTQAQKDGFISETGDVSFTAEGGIAEIKVLSNVGLAFAVPESAAWLSKEAQSSTDREDGLTEYVIKVKASENESVASRSAILSCSSADGSRAFTVGASQAAAAAFLALNTEPAVSIGADGGNVNVGFSTNGTYSIEIPATAYWIAEGARRADGKAHTQALTIDPNESVFVRTATVTFRSIEDQGLSFKVAVTQSGEDVKLALVSDSEIDVPAAGGNYNVTISTNSDYSLDNTSKADWVTPGDISSEGENVTQTFTIAENASITDRTATVTYTSNTNKSLSAAITFVQKGADIYLTRTSAATASLGKEGGNVSVTFKTNAGYSVSIPSDAGWLSTGNKSNSGDVHTQMLTVAANAAISTRTATVTFTCTDAPALSFDVAIVQTGEDIYLTRSSESAISFSSAGGSSTVTLMSNADYSISMSSAAAAWITAGEKTHSGANYTQPLAVSANTTIYERSATLTFTSAADPTLSFTVSIVQRGEDIYLTRTSAASISFNEAGGSYNVTLSSNADYKVSIPYSASWLTEGTKTHSGTTYTQPLTAAANTSTATRSATVTFTSTLNSNLSFTVSVTQSGATPYLTISPTSASITAAGGALSTTVSTNVTASYTINDTWIAYSSKSGSTYTFTIAANSSTSSRTGSVTFYNSASSTSATYTVTQAAATSSTEDHTDGAVKQLYTHTAGNGIPLVIMGDGYSQTDINNGTFDSHAAKAASNFFAIEPYTTYQNLFDVYRVEVVSPQSGISSNGSSTKLHTYIPDPTQSTEIDVKGDDFSNIFTYASKAGVNTDGGNLLIIVVMNDQTYAGTTWMWSDHLSVALCPVIYGVNSYYYKVVMQHEAGGHGFGELADEYDYSGSISESEINDYRNYQSNYDMYVNVDFTSDSTKVLWSKFIYDSRYANEGLGVYEGACTYTSGAYRPSYNSTMRDNSGGFNAPSREAIYKEMMKRAYGSSWTYNYETFVAYDAKNRTSSASTAMKAQAASSATVKHFAPPHVIIK